MPREIPVRAFHGSLISAIRELRAPAHFGSREAALAAAAAKCIEARGEANDQLSLPRGWIYGVSLQSKREPLRVDDPGGVRAMVILKAIENSGEANQQLAACAEVLRELLFKVRSRFDRQLEDVLGSYALETLAYEQDCWLLQYANAVEDPGSISYVLLHPFAVAKVGAPELLAAEDICSGWDRLSHHRQQDLWPEMAGKSLRDYLANRELVWGPVPLGGAVENGVNHPPGSADAGNSSLSTRPT